MINNHSVPTNLILPHLYYENVADASAWLTKTFGLAENYRFELPDGRLHGAMMHFGDAWIMLKSTNQTMESPAKLGGNTQSLMLFVDDIETHHSNAVMQEARIVEELFDTEYGERQYSAQDPKAMSGRSRSTFKTLAPIAGGLSILIEW